DLSKPYPFYLAYQLDNGPESLGTPSDWQAEWKWDGIRSQLIQRGGEWYLWSRGEELITDKFPELVPMADRLPDGTVIDGELLPFKDGHPLSFNVLQTRIGRKNVTKKHLTEAPCLIMAYDLLEWEGEDVRKQPLSQRRKWLAEAIEHVGMPQSLQLSPTAEFETWEELAALRETSRDQYAEGLMLKRKSAEYKVGRKRGDWWKWKVDPMTIDAVMIYAQRGHGRRANLFSDYTFAVWDGEALVPFTKAYSGLTDAEMREVDAWIKKHTIERFGPVRSVKPELVFEIGFEGINRSKRHKSGVALRFPRMLRWRIDKKANEADSIEHLHTFLRD
ncbi:MAG: cisplatin damage response ATP-dependent DNA ligase, partial [Bacteroidota bacterium]